MSKEKLKRIATVAGVTSLAAAVLLYGIYSIWKLPFLGWSGLASFLLLLGLTVFTSRFTVPVANIGGGSQTHKSVADAFIFLAVMMFTLAPANNLGPAIILAGVVACVASFDLKDKWSSALAVSPSIVATFLASVVYKLLVVALVGNGVAGNQEGLVLDLALV